MLGLKKNCVSLYRTCIIVISSKKMNKEMNISFKLKNDINYEVEKRT